VSRGGGLLSAYGNFAKTKPFENGVLISLFKACVALCYFHFMLAVTNFKFEFMKRPMPCPACLLLPAVPRALADGLAQQADNKGLHDWSRTALFAAFGALYLGMFQYAYQA
jgi:hypothetical protein